MFGLPRFYIRVEACALRILVAGVHAGGAGYPNARNTIDILRSRLGLEIVECGAWLAVDTQLWKLAVVPRTRQLLALLRMIMDNLRSLVRVLRARNHGRDIVYVPYPSLPFMLLVSLLPKRHRPRCVIDAYIPLWDALVADRRKLPKSSIAARCLRLLERRSMRAADRVLVDTVANKKMLLGSYGLDASRVCAFPLAIDEPSDTHRFSRKRADPLHDVRTTRILFVGTFIPLHGTQVIARSVAALRDNPRIQFRIVGDGQEADAFAMALGRHNANVDWHRGWMAGDAICDEVEAADVCLGVFGGSAKAARVLPLKFYLYAACGKPVVTQQELSLPEGIPMPPVIGIDPGDQDALTKALNSLAVSREQRLSRGQAMRDYYDRYLSHGALAMRWMTLLKTEGEAEHTTSHMQNGSSD